MWWHIPVIPAKRQETGGGERFKISLGYIAKAVSKKEKSNRLMEDKRLSSF